MRGKEHRWLLLNRATRSERKNERRKRRKETLLNKRQGNISDLTPARDNNVRIPFASASFEREAIVPPLFPSRSRPAFPRPSFHDPPGHSPWIQYDPTVQGKREIIFRCVSSLSFHVAPAYSLSLSTKQAISSSRATRFRVIFFFRNFFSYIFNRFQKAAVAILKTPQVTGYNCNSVFSTKLLPSCYSIVLKFYYSA